MAETTVSDSLERLLTRDPLIPGVLPDGVRRVSFATDAIPIRERIVDALREGGIIDEPMPLESFHRRVRRERLAPLQELVDPPSVRGNPAIREQYHRLVKFVAREILHFDVVFEANPFLRFHVPARMPLRYRSQDGKLLTHHNDVLVGDPFEQVNCWLPLTHCRGTGAFHISTLEESRPLLRRFAAGRGLDERTFIGSRPQFYEMLATDQAFQDEVVGICKPIEVDYGELVIFDPRVLHATTENFDEWTRISIDFRLIPLPTYEERAAQYQRLGQLPGSGGPPPLKGAFYDERTAFEL
jgi:hypothetical protein